jgi:hypothetical protein
VKEKKVVDVNEGLVHIVTAFDEGGGILGILAATTMPLAEHLADLMMEDNEDVVSVTATTLMLDKFNQTDRVH